MEEEDDDIYATESLSKYDTVLKDEEPGDGLYGWTAPKQYKSKPGEGLGDFCNSEAQRYYLPFPVTSWKAGYYIAMYHLTLLCLFPLEILTSSFNYFSEVEKAVKYIGKILDGFTLASSSTSSQKVSKPLLFSSTRPLKAPLSPPNGYLPEF